MGNNIPKFDNFKIFKNSLCMHLFLYKTEVILQPLLVKLCQSYRPAQVLRQSCSVSPNNLPKSADSLGKKICLYAYII